MPGIHAAGVRRVEPGCLPNDAHPCLPGPADADMDEDGAGSDAEQAEEEEPPTKARPRRPGMQAARACAAERGAAPLDVNLHASAEASSCSPCFAWHMVAGAAAAAAGRVRHCTRRAFLLQHQARSCGGSGSVSPLPPCYHGMAKRSEPAAQPRTLRPDACAGCKPLLSC